MKLVWDGPFWKNGGFPQLTRNYICALRENGVQVQAVHSRRWFDKDCFMNQKERQKLLEMEKQSFGFDVPRIQHTVPNRFYKENYKVNIGCTTFESNSLPSSWLEKCSQMDRVFVPNKFNYNTFIKGGVRNVCIVPPAIDIETYNKEVAPLKKDFLKGFCFLSVFYLSERKNWRTLIKSFVNTFEPQDDVSLIIKTFNRKKDAKEIINRYLKELGSSHNIIIINELYTKEQLISLYKSCHCFVLPSKGEGVGLPVIEAMLCGLPVIVTKWSGILDYANDDNSYLIKVANLEKDTEIEKLTSNFKDCLWANVDISDLQNLMEYVYKNREKAFQKGLKAKQDVERLFNSKRVSEILMNEVE